ncbi:MAG: extracellular solute-binding protein, partial [Holdemania massiliensis]
MRSIEISSDVALITVVEKVNICSAQTGAGTQSALAGHHILESETLDGINGAGVSRLKPPYFLPRQEGLEFRLAQFENELGHLWAVPATLSASGVAYNRTVAQAFLATEDPVQVGIVFSSWADVISKGMKFKEQFPDRAMFASLEDAAVMLFGQSRTPYIQATLLQPYRFLNAFQILDALQEAGLVFSLQQYSPQWMNSLETDQVFFYPCSLWLMSMGIFHTGQAWGFTRAPSGSFAWGGTVWAIPKTSTHAATAWEFMQTVLLSPSGAAYAKNHGTGTLISYSPAYSEEGYSDLIMEDFGGQNIGKMYLDQIFPEVQTRPAGENEALLKEVYLQT